MADLSINKAYSTASSAQEAISEIKEQLGSAPSSVTILFVSSKYPLDELAEAIREAFSDRQVVACTSSGEISAGGYLDFSISAVSISSPRLKVENYFYSDIRNFTVETAEVLAEKVDAKLEDQQRSNKNIQAFGLLLIDGMSVLEEGIAAALSSALPQMQFAGGSAGDDLKFDKTYIYHKGKFHSDAAIFSVFFTDHPFKVFKTQHFIPNEEAKLVITEANTGKRIVREINGLPAAEEYARLVGVEVDKLEPMTFSKYPVMIRIGGDYYVRSIQKVNDDESLTFFCAIDEGLVLTVAKGVDIIENLESKLEEVTNEIHPKLILGCECILRRLEILEKGLEDKAADVMNKYNVIGFHTYGEQFNGLHINQTLTGIAIGE